MDLLRDIRDFAVPLIGETDTPITNNLTANCESPADSDDKVPISEDDGEPGVDSDDMVRILGQGYNMFTGNTAPSDIFDHSTKSSNYGLIIPKSAKVSRLHDARTFMDLQKSKKETNSTLKNPNNSLAIENSSSFLFESRAGYNTETSEMTTDSSSEYSFYIEHRLEELRMGNFEELKFTPDFVSDVEQLPSKIDVTNKENRDDFLMFFERWGTHVITKAYVGGRIEVNINASAIQCNSETELSPDQLKAALTAAFSSALFSAKLCNTGEAKTSFIDTKKVLGECNFKIFGGASKFQNKSTLTDNDLVSQWRMSLKQYPEILHPRSSDMRNHVLPINKAAEKVDKEKSIAIRRFMMEAFKDGKIEVEPSNSSEAANAQKGPPPTKAKCTFLKHIIITCITCIVIAACSITYNYIYNYARVLYLYNYYVYEYVPYFVNHSKS